VVFRPTLQYQPTYQIKPKKLFNSFEIELLLKKIIEHKTESLSDKINFKELAQELSNEILV
jgi:hypothetical protein